MLDTTNRHVELLSRALLANTLFSLVCALVFLLASAPLASAVGARREELLFTGASLVVFVGLLTLVRQRLGSLRPWVLALAVVIAALDVVWVLGTPISITPYTPLGKTLFVGIGLAVALFAALQIRALVGIFSGLRARRESPS